MRRGYQIEVILDGEMRRQVTLIIREAVQPDEDESE